MLGLKANKLLMPVEMSVYEYEWSSKLISKAASAVETSWRGWVEIFSRESFFYGSRMRGHMAADEKTGLDAANLLVLVPAGSLTR